MNKFGAIACMLMAVLFLASGSVFAGTTAPDKEFKAFCAKLKKVVVKKDTKALAAMMTEKRQWALETSMGKDDVRQLNDVMWDSLGKALAQKPEVIKDKKKCRKAGTCYSMEDPIMPCARIMSIKINGKWKVSEISGD